MRIRQVESNIRLACPRRRSVTAMTRNQKKHFLIQITRRACQITVLIVMMFTIYLSLYAHYRAALALEEQTSVKSIDGRVLNGIDRIVGQMDDPQPFLDSFKGTIWSMRFAGIDLTDPLAATETVATSHTVFLPLLVSIIIPVIVTIFLGRVFCSWMCPAGLLFELTERIRRILGFVEIKPGDVKFANRNKYILLLVGLIFAAVFGLPVLGHIYPPAVISRIAHSWVYGTALTDAISILGIMVAFEVMVSPRWWCRTMCPGGALYGLIGSMRLVRIRLDAKKCTACRDCIPACPMGLNPVQQSYGIECDNCALCIRHCSDDALLYTIGLPGKKRAYIKPKRIRPTAAPAIVHTNPPLTQKEDEAMIYEDGEARPRSAPEKKVGIVPATSALLIALIVTIAAPQPAYAHHILGIPHYSYKEDYPQAPTLEYPASTGPYDLLMTSYPGVAVPGEPAIVTFYIKNRNTGEPFPDAVTVRVLETATFGRNTITHESTRIMPLDKTHKITVTFPEDAEYIVELTMNVEGIDEVIPFLVVAGHPTATTSIITSIGIGLVLFVVIIRAIKIKQMRRRAHAESEESVACAVRLTPAGT